MILIYSNHCKHCNILLETIKRHDTKNLVEKISVDTLRNENYNIEGLIHSVPAMIVNKNKIIKEEILFGKQVFDYLLLPNRGALFSQDNNTRLNKETKDSKENTNIGVGINEVVDNDEPMAFSLGSTMSDNFSSLDENSDNLLKDKVYKWDLLNNDDNISKDSNSINPLSINPVSSITDKEDNKLPSLEELLNKRNKDIF